MSYPADGISRTFTAAEALTGRRLATLETTGTVSMADAGETPIGYIPSDVASGASTAIYFPGTIVLLEVNAGSVDINAGDFIKPTTNGVGIKTTTAVDEIGAIALEPATVDGQFIRVLLVSRKVG